MSRQSRLRRAGAALLGWTERHASPDLRAWAAAIAGEYPHVAGDWEAFRWALGGAAVVLPRSLLRQGSRPAGSDMEVNMRPAPSRNGFAAVMGVLAVLGLLLNPVVRDGLRASLAAWSFFEWEPLPPEKLEALEQQARAERDAETLVFLALTPNMPAEKAFALIEEASAWKPEETWAFSAVLYRCCPPPPQSAEAIARLKAWDPQNAVPHMSEAGLFVKDDPRRAAALEAAFAAERYDSYLAQRAEIVRAVQRRRHLEHPLVALQLLIRQPVPDVGPMFDYVRGVNARPDKEIAAARMARFAELIAAGSETDIEQLWAAELLKRAAGVAPGLGISARQPWVRVIAGQRVTNRVAHQMGVLLQGATGALLVALPALALLAGLWLWLRRRVSRWSAMAGAGAFGAVVLALCAEAVIYVTYRPLQQAYADFLVGNEGARGMMAFSGVLNGPIGAYRLWYSGTPEVWFWYAVIVLAGAALIAVAWRGVRRRVSVAG